MPQAGSVNSGSFDFNSQTGVMSLLAAIRTSESLDAEQRAELRDLVFAYANGGGDAIVRRAIEQKIATYGLVPVAIGQKKADGAADAPPPAPVRPFGKSRPAPQFSPVSVVGTITPPSVPPVPPVIPMSEPVPVAQPEQPPIPVTPVSQPQPESESVAPTAPQPLVPVAEPETAPAPTPTGFDPEAARQRILEIKALVNQRVGNPVNLVDIDNVVGREYMVALLEAMKRVGGGMPGDLGEAMNRLEAAYAAVETALATHASVGSAPPVSGQEKDVSSRPVSPPPVEPVVSESATPPRPVPPVVPVVQSEPEPAVYAPTPEPSVEIQPEEPKLHPEVATAPTRPAIPAAKPAPVFRATSLAEDTTRVLTPADLPEAAAIETSTVVGDPLYTKEVESGLAQLLLEWEIFKKSGLFGTGPRGFEHPLFKTLAGMTISAILAGKFEGATPEIRQSVTDYMNGWRYEHGIVHSQDETFERYLRRVVRYIIDLQKRRV